MKKRGFNINNNESWFISLYLQVTVRRDIYSGAQRKRALITVSVMRATG